MGNRMLSYWYKLYMNQTTAEQFLEKHICKLGVRYRTQHIILSCSAFLDFYLPDYNLCIEVDDPGHMTKKQTKKDEERTTKLNKKGIRVVRYSNAQVINEIDSVIRSIQSEIS
jgi:very-short-patch-repair endonuclease